MGCTLSNPQDGSGIPTDFPILQPNTDIFCDPSCDSEITLTASEQPMLTQNPGLGESWDLALADAVQLALEHSQIIRDLGGRALRAQHR